MDFWGAPSSASASRDAVVILRTPLLADERVVVPIVVIRRTDLPVIGVDPRTSALPPLRERFSERCVVDVRAQAEAPGEYLTIVRTI